ncbi:unnamed protein product [Urochloa humidicola]
MVAGSITEELAMAEPAELLWKTVFATGDESSFRNMLTGLSDDMDVKVDGDGGPGSHYTLKFNPSVGAEKVLHKSRLVVRDNVARVINYDEVVLEGGEVAAAQLKSQAVQYKVEPAARGRLRDQAGSGVGVREPRRHAAVACERGQAD